MIAVLRNGSLVKYDGPDGILYGVTDYDGEPQLHALDYDGHHVLDIEDEPGDHVSLDLVDGRTVVITQEEFDAL